ncbi:hypothetical protein HDU98_012005 [Podochytrium sp. JEL0797]|nr:hypothetical protein HDU98_012005 [Podochytrium sp. JEL0797]
MRIILCTLVVGAVSFALASPDPATLLNATIANLPTCAVGCTGNVNSRLTGPGLAAVCADLAGYSAKFTACVTSSEGCSSAGSMSASQAQELIPALQASCNASGFSSPPIVYANQISKRKTIAYFRDFVALTTLQKANLSNMDVLIYAYVDVTSDGNCSFGTAKLDNLHFALAQRATFPNLRVVLSVGANATTFSAATSTSSSRVAFAQTCAALVYQVNADGLDIDWEYPTAEDASNILPTVQLLRTALGYTKTLSFVISDRVSNILPAALPSLAPFLDWYGVRSYGYTSLGLQATSPTTNLDNVVRSILLVGIQPSQIVVGIAFYGFVCKLPTNGDKTSLVSCVAQSDDDLLAHGVNGTSAFDNFTFAHYDFLLNDNVLIYNTPQSAQLKAQYVIDTGLCGIMMWELSQDATFGMYDTIASVFQTVPVTSVNITVPGNSATGACNGTVLDPHCGGGDSNTGLIVGVCVAVFLVLCVLAATGVSWWYRKRAAGKQTEEVAFIPAHKSSRDMEVPTPALEIGEQPVVVATTSASPGIFDGMEQVMAVALVTEEMEPFVGRSLREKLGGKKEGLFSDITASAGKLGVKKKEGAFTDMAARMETSGARLVVVENMEETLNVLHGLGLGVNPAKWTVPEAATWMLGVVGENSVTEGLMKDHEIDGQALMTLAPEMLMDLLEIRVIGRRVKFSNGVKALNALVLQQQQLSSDGTLAEEEGALPAYGEI